MRRQSNGARAGKRQKTDLGAHHQRCLDGGIDAAQLMSLPHMAWIDTDDAHSEASSLPTLQLERSLGGSEASSEAGTPLEEDLPSNFAPYNAKGSFAGQPLCGAMPLGALQGSTLGFGLDEHMGFLLNRGVGSHAPVALEDCQARSAGVHGLSNCSHASFYKTANGARVLPSTHPAFDEALMMPDSAPHTKELFADLQSLDADLVWGFGSNSVSNHVLTAITEAAEAPAPAFAAGPSPVLGGVPRPLEGHPMLEVMAETVLSVKPVSIQEIEMAGLSALTVEPITTEAQLWADQQWGQHSSGFPMAEGALKPLVRVN